MTEPIEFSPLEGEKEFVSKQKRAYKFKRGVKLDSEFINVGYNNLGNKFSVARESSPEFLSSLQLTKKFNPQHKVQTGSHASPQLCGSLCLTEREGNNIPDTDFSLFTKPSRDISEAKVERQLTETLSFRCWSERCRLMRGAVNYQDYKVAFTLVEVLITLGIIGVVAAMTMPTLIQNYRKNLVVTRLQKFYSTMNQAIKQSEVDNGDKLYWEKMEKILKLMEKLSLMEV